MSRLALALLLFAAPARAITPAQLDPMEKWVYDTYTKRNDAAALPDRPANVDESKAPEAKPVALNPATPFPDHEYYDTKLLKPDEVEYMLMQMRQTRGK